MSGLCISSGSGDPNDPRLGVPVFYKRLAWDKALEGSDKVALYHLSRGVNKCDYAALNATDDPAKQLAADPAFELFVFDVVGFHILLAATKASEPNMYQTRQRTFTGDREWRPPDKNTIINNYILHIASLVLWVYRISQLSARRLPLPNGVRPLPANLQTAVVSFASACRTHIPDEWSQYVNAGPRDRTALEQRHDLLKSKIAYDDQRHLRGLVHALGLALYCSAVNMCVMLCIWVVVAIVIVVCGRRLFFQPYRKHSTKAGTIPSTTPLSCSCSRRPARTRAASWRSTRSGRTSARCCFSAVLQSCSSFPWLAKQWGLWRSFTSPAVPCQTNSSRTWPCSGTSGKPSPTF